MASPSWIQRGFGVVLTLALSAAAFEGGVAFESGALGMRDDLVVPLVFSGVPLGLGGFARWEGWQAHQDARARLSLAMLTNRFAHEAIGVDEELSWWLDWLAPAPLPSTMTLGTGLVSRSRFAVLESWDDAHGYWIGSLSLPASVGASGSVLGRPWRGRFSIAVLALQSRPPEHYAVKQQPLADPRFVLDRQFFGLEPVAPWDHLDLELETWMKTGWRGLEWGTTLGMVRASQPRQAFVLNAIVKVGYRWGGTP